MKLGIVIVAALLAIADARAADYPNIIQTSAATNAVADGVRAYRARDFQSARELLAASATAGDTRAQRYLAYATLDDQSARPDDLMASVALLKDAAIAGDYAALIRLEDLRRLRLAHSPSLADIVAIEQSRAEAGDPVTAWRLAARIDAGEAIAGDDLPKWLAVAAEAELSDFPKAGEAAFRLCEIRALGAAGERDAAAARHWCEKAADSGHAGAAIVLRRLASL